MMNTFEKTAHTAFQEQNLTKAAEQFLAAAEAYTHEDNRYRLFLVYTKLAMIHSFLRYPEKTDAYLSLALDTACDCDQVIENPRWLASVCKTYSERVTLDRFIQVMDPDLGTMQHLAQSLAADSILLNTSRKENL